MYHSNRWGTVCDDRFGKEAAMVACRSLGLPFRNAHASEYGQFGAGGPGQPIWLDEVSCTGSESHLSECGNDGGWGRYDCIHDEDAGVICLGEGSR